MRQIAQLLKADRGIDVVAKNCLAGVEIAARRHSTLSRSNSFRNFGSRATRACTVALKSFVNGILSSTLPLFVVRPALVRPRDIVGLALLGSPANQDDHCLAVLAEVDAVAGPKVDPVLEDAASDAFHVRDIPQLNPRQRRRHPGGSCRIQAVEPAPNGLLPAPSGTREASAP